MKEDNPLLKNELPKHYVWVRFQEWLKKHSRKTKLNKQEVK